MNLRTSGRGNELTLCLAGDVMTGRGIDQVPPHPGSPRLYQQNGLHADDYVQKAERRNGPIPAPLGFRSIWGAALAKWSTSDIDYRMDSSFPFLSKALR